MDTQVAVECKNRNIYNALRVGLNVEIIKNLLKTEGDINREILTDSGIKTNLLFTSYFLKPTVIDLLLEFGIDFTKKNDKGRTVIHELIHYHLKKESLLRIQGTFKNEFLNAILPAHIKFNNKSNPCDEYGISHFHAACIANNAVVVEFFLKNDVDINQTVNSDSPVFPGDTALHIAARYSSAESVEILLKYGANILLKNVNGLTAMHVLIDICRFRFEMLSTYEKTLNVLLRFVINDMGDIGIIDDYGFHNLHVACILQDESLVKSILEKTKNIDQAVNLDSPICPGYTAQHFAASSKIEIFQLLLDNRSNVSAENASGATSIDLFLQNYGVSEMHYLLLSRKELKNIVLSDNKTKLIDTVIAMKNKESFISFLNQTQLSINTHVSFDSPLWPGYTLLHITVVFAEKALYIKHSDPRRIYDDKIVDECLKRGADITKADAKGSTAIHLAFYIGKRHLVKFLLDKHDKPSNPVDKDNLSHFHIACAVRHLFTVKHFLSIGVDINSRVLGTFMSHVRYSSIVGYPYRYFVICPGSTALHINVASGDSMITQVLLKNGADLYAKDVNGLTPVHRMLTSIEKRLRKRYFYELNVLLDRNLKDCVAKCGFSHLHVASYFGHNKAIEELLDSGADVNCVVTYKGKCKKQYYDELYDPYGDVDDPLNFLCDYADYTPLHFSMLDEELLNESSLLLIDRGADIFKKAADGNCFLKYLADHKFRDRNVMFVLNKSSVVRENFEKHFGWTKLHFVCCATDLKLVKKAMSQGENVNARINSDSPVWKGYTPLHVVVLIATMNYNEKGVMDKLKKIVGLLIKNGADLTLMDDNYDTPFHLCSKAATLTEFLFKSLKNYSVNPTNLDGDSLFHIACATQNVVAVEKFLNHDVDVNQPVSYLSYSCPGGTPLHLAIKPSKIVALNINFKDDDTLQIVENLIVNGANVNANDAFGETPLFGIIESTNLRSMLTQKFISEGADVHATNLKGITPFECLLLQVDVTWKEIELFLEAGCHFNTFNPVSQKGYIAEVFRFRQRDKLKWRDDEILLKIIDSPHMIDKSKDGRTAIHNVVSIEDTIKKCYTGIIRRLILRGCDIDHQDDEGKTALHLAVNFKNTAGVIGLLKNGADVNLTDNSRNTPFTYVGGLLGNCNNVWFNPRKVMIAFTTHIRKLELCGLHVNKQNKKLQVEALKEYPLEDNDFSCFHGEIKKSKDLEIIRSLSLYEFLMNTHADVVYMNMSGEERQEVDRFFQKIEKFKFVEIDCLIKLKYKQTVQRTNLFEPALISLNMLIKYRLPDLCCRNILEYLRNEDLKSLIDSVVKINKK